MLARMCGDTAAASVDAKAVRAWQRDEHNIGMRTTAAWV
jgi:hypothetical protein